MEKFVWRDLTEQEQYALLQRPVSAVADAAVASVRKIMAAVKKDGDAAIRSYTQQFDGYDPAPVFVTEEECKSAAKLSPALKEAIQTAAANIRRFHERQGYSAFSVETMPGLHCARRVVPIEGIGLYIPGGTAPLFSTVLMLGIPSQIAGNPHRLLCTPGREIHPAILYAAQLCGIEKIARVGGAQAIAGLAYGTETLPKADKIFGPGNLYVTLAKTLATQEAGGPAIDMPAGPSEVLVIATDETPPVFAAADLLSQAEHDVSSQVILIATSAEKCAAILREIDSQLAILPRRDIAAGALKNSRAIIVDSIDQAIDISNRYAPEHLILCFAGAEQYQERIKNAGSVFSGLQTPEAVGDYASGTNHVLPTAAAARSYSGLGVEAFQKTITWQTATPAALAAIGPAVMTMAGAETLAAHANAITVRLKEKIP